MPQPPAVGTVEDGYRFNGGNPADPRAWSKAVAGTTPRPDYGQSAYETRDGSILNPTKNGNVQVMKGPRATASAEGRTRLALALGPAVEAQRSLMKSEAPAPGAKQGVNPYNRDWGARMAEKVPFDNGVIARVIGGEDYQRYEQAARTIESSILPIFSGAAVTESEAKRFLRANQPQMGDAPNILAQKSRNRMMMLNGAAELMGEAPPFPEVGSWRVSSQTGGRQDRIPNSPVDTPEARAGRASMAARPQAAQAATKTLRYNPKTGKIE